MQRRQHIQSTRGPRRPAVTWRMGLPVDGTSNLARPGHMLPTTPAADDPDLLELAQEIADWRASL